MIQDISIGSAPNDKTGTPARQAGQMINSNFAYLDNKITRKDGVVVSTGSSILGQDVTYNAFWQWIIDTIDYTNPEDVVINFPLATTGNSRLDLVALTTSNTFVRIPGTESDSNPVSPSLPDNMVQAGFVLVTDSTVGDPSPPVTGDVFVKKIESQDFIFNSGATTVINQIDLIDDRSSISLIGSATDVKSVQLPTAFIRPGKPHFFKNRTGHDVKLWHLAGTGNIKYFFPNGLDLIVKPNEVIEFNMNANDSANVRFEYVSGASDYIGKMFIENTGNYFFKDNDHNKMIRFDSTLNTYAMIPHTSELHIPIGSLIEVKKANTGAVKIQASSGVTLEIPSGYSSEIDSRYDAVVLQHEKTNTWGIYGKTKTSASTTADPTALAIAQTSGVATLFWPNIYKSSDFPEVTTTKAYFILYSTDHDASAGGVWWGEFDSFAGNILTGFVQRGRIFTGYQVETPFLIKIPTSESGLASETLFLYTHTNSTDPSNAGVQQSHLHTSTGGLLHTATWTDRGKPLGLQVGENHTGYLRVWKRGVNDYIGNHMYNDTVLPRQGAISTSTNGLTFTRQGYYTGFEGMPTGGYLERSTLQAFVYNSILYGTFKYTDASGVKFIAIAKLDSITYLPQTFVKTLFRTNVRDCRLYIEGNYAYILNKAGEDGDLLNTNPYYLFKYNLNDLEL
jgi:hypothetical protein